MVDSVVSVVLALPVRDTRPRVLQRNNLHVPRLDACLAERVPGFRTSAEDAAGTWQLLADLHDRGLLDVSAAPSRYLVTGVRVVSPVLAGGFAGAVSGKAARAAEEVRLLRDFFDDSTTCANRKFADYFGVADLPEGCCSQEDNRCSACWDSGAWPLGETKPRVAIALETPRPRPHGTTDRCSISAATPRRAGLTPGMGGIQWRAFAGRVPRATRGGQNSHSSCMPPAGAATVRSSDQPVLRANPSVRFADIEVLAGAIAGGREGRAGRPAVARRRACAP